MIRPSRLACLAPPCCPSPIAPSNLPYIKVMEYKISTLLQNIGISFKGRQLYLLTVAPDGDSAVLAGFFSFSPHLFLY